MDVLDGDVTACHKVCHKPAEPTKDDSILISTGDLMAWHPLDGVPAPEYVPQHWIGPHVGQRLVAAFKVLARLPMQHVRESGGFWPQYRHEWADLVAQRDAEAADLELQAYLSNRSRNLPSAQEVSHMEAAISWPARYLNDRPLVMRVVQRVAAMRARDLEMDRIARSLKKPPRPVRTINRVGLDLIAAGLRRDQIAVF